MWSVFLMAKEVHARPSELLNIRDDYEAYCVDEVVLMWGSYIEEEVGKVGQKVSAKEKTQQGQRLTKLRALLREDGKPEQRKFASPIATR